MNTGEQPTKEQAADSEHFWIAMKVTEGMSLSQLQLLVSALLVEAIKRSK